MLTGLAGRMTPMGIEVPNRTTDFTFWSFAVAFGFIAFVVLCLGLLLRVGGRRYWIGPVLLPCALLALSRVYYVTKYPPWDYEARVEWLRERGLPPHTVFSPQPGGHSNADGSRQ